MYEAGPKRLTVTNKLTDYAKELITTVKSLWNMPRMTYSAKHTNLHGMELITYVKCLWNMLHRTDSDKHTNMALITVVKSFWSLPHRTDNDKHNLQWNGINYGCKKFNDEATIGLTATNTLTYNAKELITAVKSLWNMLHRTTMTNTVTCNAKELITAVKSLWNMFHRTDSNKHTNLQYYGINYNCKNFIKHHSTDNDKHTNLALMAVVNSLWNIPYRTDNAKHNLQWNGINYGCKKFNGEATLGLTATNTLTYNAKELITAVKSQLNMSIERTVTNTLTYNEIELITAVKGLWNMPQRTDGQTHKLKMLWH